jgi:hypothetical protein
MLVELRRNARGVPDSSPVAEAADAVEAIEHTTER